MVDLHGTFGDQEKAAESKDQVLTAKAFVVVKQKIGGDGKQRFRELNDPGDAEQEADAYEHGKKEAGVPGSLAHVLRQFVGRDRDENDIVNA